MWFSAGQNVVEQTRHNKKITQPEERDWPVLLNEGERKSRDRGGQNRYRCQQHQAFMRVDAAAEIEGGAHENCKYQHVAKRNSEKREGINSGHGRRSFGTDNCRYCS